MRTSSIYQSSARCTEKKKKEKKKERKRLGQYNSNNKLIHGQYTSRYNLHHTHTYTHTHTHTHTHTPHSMSNDVDLASTFLIKLKLCRIVKSNRQWMYHYFSFLHMFRGDNWRSLIWQTLKHWLFAGHCLKSFKLCMVVILPEVYLFILSLVTLTLFQGQWYVRILNWKLFLDSCPL